MTTAESGQLKVLQKLMSLGAINVSVCKEGRRTFIKFDSPTGKKYKVTTRAKMSGTWQTSINYANKCVPDKNDDEFWIFIDIRKEPGTFYITPLSWIQNDIYEAHSDYLDKHNGRRAINDNSTHHAISVKRISEWKDAWAQLGFNV